MCPLKNIKLLIDLILLKWEDKKQLSYLGFLHDKNRRFVPECYREIDHCISLPANCKLPDAKISLLQTLVHIIGQLGDSVISQHIF